MESPQLLSHNPFMVKRDADSQDKGCFHSRTGLIRHCFYTFSCWLLLWKETQRNSYSTQMHQCLHTAATTIAAIYTQGQHTERTHQVRTWNLASRESKLLLLFCGHQICSHPCVICCVYLFCAIFVPLNGHLWLPALAISVFLLLCLVIHVCLLLFWYSADRDFLDLAYGICALSIILYTGFIPPGSSMLKREATWPLSFVIAVLSERGNLHCFLRSPF